MTMDDVAREAGVSRALVSLVMRGSDEGQRRAPRARARRGRAARLPAQRDRAQPRLAPHQHRRDPARTTCTTRSSRRSRRASRSTRPSSGYRLLIITGGRRKQRERAMLEALLEYRTDGLILVSPRPDRDRRSPPTSARCRASSSAAACAAAHRLRDDRRGRSARTWRSSTSSRSATRASSTSTAATARAPRPAARATCARWRTPGSSRAAEVVPGEFTEERGRCGRRARCCARRALPTAVIAANDLVAVGLIDRLEQDGVRIPEDVSVVGYDNTFVAGLSAHPADDHQPAAPRDGRRGVRAVARAHRPAAPSARPACTSRRSSCARRPGRRDDARGPTAGRVRSGGAGWARSRRRRSPPRSRGGIVAGLALAARHRCA